LAGCRHLWLTGSSVAGISVASLRSVATGVRPPLRYDLMKDFEPVGLIATQPFLIAARKAMPANNLKELIAWLRANGDKTNVGHSGVGTPAHVAGLLFEKAIGTNFTMVP